VFDVGRTPDRQGSPWPFCAQSKRPGRTSSTYAARSSLLKVALNVPGDSASAPTTVADAVAWADEARTDVPESFAARRGVPESELLGPSWRVRPRDVERSRGKPADRHQNYNRVLSPIRDTTMRYRRPPFGSVKLRKVDQQLKSCRGNLDDLRIIRLVHQVVDPVTVDGSSVQSRRRAQQFSGFPGRQERHRGRASPRRFCVRGSGFLLRKQGEQIAMVMDHGCRRISC